MRREASREAAVYLLAVLRVVLEITVRARSRLIFLREVFFFVVERFRRVDFALLITVRVPIDVKPDTAKWRASS